MKRIFFIAAAACACHFSSTAQDGAAEQKAWMEYATPSQMHQMLAKSNGNWNEEITMWMKPGTPPMKSTATSKNEMLMDGRYQQTTTTGSFMGMPFHGMSTTGYDNAKKVFFTTWIDNMGTGLMYGEGKWNNATKSIDFKGKTMDPMTKKEVPYREVITIMDDNHQKMEMYMMNHGKEFKSMEIVMTKA